MVFVRFLSGIFVSSWLLCSVAVGDVSLVDLVELLDEHSPDLLTKAEGIYAKLPKDGAAHFKATYALALVATREGQLDRAVEVLGLLPNEEKKQPPVLRLRLWLALERDEAAIAQRLFAMLREMIDNPKVAESDRLEAARLLGGVCGISPDGDINLPDDLIARSIKSLPAATENKVTSAFRQAQSATGKRRKQLQEIIEESKDAAAAKDRLTEAEAEREKLENAIVQGGQDLGKRIVDDREADKIQTAEMKKLRKLEDALSKAWNSVTEGYPKEPKPPKAPSKGKDDKDRPSASEQREYERDLRAYEKEVREYPAKLQAWQIKDQYRRAKLRESMAENQAELARQRAEAKTRAQETNQMRAEVTKQRNQIHDVELQLRLLRTAVSVQDVGEEVILRRPSSYELLSFPLERQNLLNSLR